MAAVAGPAGAPKDYGWPPSKISTLTVTLVVAMPMRCARPSHATLLCVVRHPVALSGRWRARRVRYEDRHADMSSHF